MSPRSSTATLIEALRVLSRDVQSDDGVANAALAEAAERMEELHKALEEVRGISSLSIPEELNIPRSQYYMHQLLQTRAEKIVEMAPDKKENQNDRSD